MLHGRVPGGQWVARIIDAYLAIGDEMGLSGFSKHDPPPNDKRDFNIATLGGNLPGASRAWPGAGYARRGRIAKEHENYHRGLLQFLATDPRVPQKLLAECESLWETFALSAIHVAFASIRMEPVFMVPSQSAATAACLALDGGVSAQEVDYDTLRARLERDGQVLEWKHK